jgi:hypothetical protein
VNSTDGLSSAERNAGESPLLRLPAEIRNYIWTYVLATEQIVVSLGEEASACAPPEPAPDFAFLSSCRQAYAEAALLPLILAYFQFQEPNDMISLLAELSSGQGNAIRDIILYCDDVQGYPLRLLPGLTSMDVICMCDHFCGTCSHHRDPFTRQSRKDEIRRAAGNPSLKV